MMTLGFFAPWAPATPARIRAAAPTTPTIRSRFICVPPRSAPESLLLVQRRIEIGQLDRIEQVLDLILGQDLLLPDDLENALAALVGLVCQLGGLVVTDHRIERGDDAHRGLEVVLEHFLVHCDAVDA